MRQALGPKKLALYSRRYGLPFVRGLVRGGTGHRVDLWTADGRGFCFFEREPDRLYRCDEQGQWREEARR